MECERRVVDESFRINAHGGLPHTESITVNSQNQLNPICHSAFLNRLLSPSLPPFSNIHSLCCLRSSSICACHRMVLSYRHAYHAGNAGDVVKHSILSLVLCALAKKHKPYFFLDTHAAAGQFALDQQQPNTSRPLNREYATGIGRLWTLRHAPRSIAPYLHTVRAINGFTATAASSPAASIHSSDDCITDEAAAAFSLPPSSPVYSADAYQPQSLRHYPGSPALFLQLRRPQDRMLAIEKHSTEQQLLQHFLHSQPPHHTAYSHYPPPSSPLVPSSSAARGVVRPSRVLCDDFVASLPLLPPVERRGLVFIDPPYELSSEYDAVVSYMRDGLRRWQSGGWMLWYPLLHGKEQLALDMLAAITSLGCTRLLDVRFSLYSHMADRLAGRGGGVQSGAGSGGSGRVSERVSLYGCGVLLVNPPYLLDSLLSSSLLPFLSRTLGTPRSPADFSVRWLTAQQSEPSNAVQHDDHVNTNDVTQKKD